MPRVPSLPVLTAARALGVPVERLTPLAGASGRSWAAGENILRVSDAATLDVEIAACPAAASVVVTPEVVDRVDLDNVSALLVRRLPGTPAGQLDDVDPSRARARGQACGRLHRALAAVPAPTGAAAGGTAGSVAWQCCTARGDRLLHLDLYRFNVLIDGDAVCGVLDWTNAAAGHPVVDRARSFSILTLDPAAVARRVDPRWVALTDGWIDGGELRNLPAPAMAWACRFMLDDLSKRDDIQQLAAVAAALEHAEWLVRRAR